MTSPLASMRLVLSPSRRRAGFSFAEVMFAVMLLGLGFIMVAAIFPVAIRQQQASMEDTSGVVVAKRGAALIQQMGTTFAQYNPLAADANYGNYTNLIQDNPAKIYPGGGPVSPAKVNPLLFTFQADASPPSISNHVGAIPPYRYVKGDLIQQSDRRFAWMPVAYASALDSEYAKVYLVAVQSRVSEQFTDTDRNNGDNGTGPFVPILCYFKLVEGGTSYPDTLVFTSPTGDPVDQPAAAEGAFVWVADDNVTATPSSTASYKAAVPGASNGRFYRLGVQRSDLGAGVWELQPGNDMTVTTTPGPDNDWSTTGDNQEQNENLPPRPTDSQPVNYGGISGSAARGLLVGRGRDSGGNFTGNNMALFALPPVTVRIKP